MLKSAPQITIYCLVTETKGQMFQRIPGFYLTSGLHGCDLLTHLVAMKCEVSTTTSTREIQLCIQAATQLMRSPLFPAKRVCQLNCDLPPALLAE